jgi:hypothetical protein
MVLKKCSCGIEYNSLPENYRVGDAGHSQAFFFECSCGSTLTVPFSRECDRVLILLDEIRNSPVVAMAEVLLSTEVDAMADKATKVGG